MMAVFGASLSLPLSVDRRGKLVLPLDEKATLFLVYFDAKQCRDRFQQQHSCDSSPVLCSVAFWSSFICSLLLVLGLYGGNDLHDMFQLFFQAGSLGAGI